MLGRLATVWDSLMFGRVLEYQEGYLQMSSFVRLSKTSSRKQVGAWQCPCIAAR